MRRSCGSACRRFGHFSALLRHHRRDTKSGSVVYRGNCAVFPRTGIFERFVFYLALRRKNAYHVPFRQRFLVDSHPAAYGFDVLFFGLKCYSDLCDSAGCGHNKGNNRLFAGEKRALDKQYCGIIAAYPKKMSLKFRP